MAKAFTPPGGNGNGSSTSKPPPFVQKTGPQSFTGGVTGIPIIERLANGADTPYRPYGLYGKRSLGWACDSVAAVGKWSSSEFGSGQAWPVAPDFDYSVARWVMRDPTIRVAMAMIMGPIVGSEMSFLPRDADVPQEQVDFIREQYNPIRVSLKWQLLRALIYGSRSFEQLYKPVESGGQTLVGIHKFKPLRPDVTDVLIDKKTGEYAGLKNGKATLSPEQTLHWAYDNEDDNWYGMSRLLGVYEFAFWPWVCLLQQFSRLAKKTSNIIPIVKGPISVEEEDEQGNKANGYDVGLTIVDALVDAKGVVMENFIGLADDIINQPELAKASKWNVDAFDTGQTHQGLQYFLDGFAYFDKLKMRGLLRPERIAMDSGGGGTTGPTAEQQADIALAEGDYIGQQLSELISWHSIDRLLVWNFGEEARGNVYARNAPLVDEKKVFYKQLFLLLWQNPTAAKWIISKIDVDGMADSLNVPRLTPLNDGFEEFMQEEADRQAANAAAAAANGAGNNPAVPPPGNRGSNAARRNSPGKNKPGSGNPGGRRPDRNAA